MQGILYLLKLYMKSNLYDNPFDLFKKWFSLAKNKNILYYNAFALATSYYNGNISVRMLLLKEFNSEGFIFFTNYNSLKSKQIKENPQGEMLFFWKELRRQIRIHGKICILNSSDSDIYFSNRPRGSQLSSWASPQSSIIPNREFLIEKFNYYKAIYKNKTIPRPNFWGGFILLPESFEFWKERHYRLHERILFKLIDNKWHKFFLAP